MEKFSIHKGVGAPLRMMNVDTDMIIPKQFLKTIKRTGLARGLFAELRFGDDGQLQENFVLNQTSYQKASILVAGDNFGCGSSREHAPWALLDYGFRCVIAPSFADIFYNNCFKNGILPIVLGKTQIEGLWTYLEQHQGAQLQVDLIEQSINYGDDLHIAFEVDPFRKKCLLEGLDDIGLTLAFEQNISDFEKKAQTQRPWI